jgi:hypothetical protein
MDRVSSNLSLWVGAPRHRESCFSEPPSSARVRDRIGGVISQAEGLLYSRRGQGKRRRRMVPPAAVRP